jgi:hypothetical protein
MRLLPAPSFAYGSHYCLGSKEELRDLVAGFHVAGKQVSVHRNGDVAIDGIIDAIGAARRLTPRSGARPVLLKADIFMLGACRSGDSPVFRAPTPAEV